MNPSDSLTLVLTNTFQNFPRVLFEDSADEFLDEKTIDRLYEFDALINSSPYSQVYEIRDEYAEVKGVLWLQIDPVLNAISSRFLSVLPEYRDGSVAGKIDAFMVELAKHLGLERIFGSTQKDLTHWRTYGWEAVNTKIIMKEVK